ncbi:MAG: ParB/RepB/Spo0J family partition protein [Bacillota bacterium]
MRLGGRGTAGPKGRRQVLQVPVDLLAPNPHQPRWDGDDVEGLCSSIREHGLLQPVVVRRTGNGYQVVAGHRRLRAAREAGLRTVPAVVTECSEAEAAVLALVENLQREGLSPIEEAEAYRRILEEFHLSQEELARRVGLSQATVANRLRLLRLPAEIRAALHEGVISERHGRALLRLRSEEEMLRVFRLVVEGDLRVQEAERLVEEVVGEGKGAGGDEGKRGRPRLAALRDLRIFLNTFRATVQALREAGVPARMEERDAGDELVVTVYIERPRRGAGVAKRTCGQGAGGGEPEGRGG